MDTMQKRKPKIGPIGKAIIASILVVGVVPVFAMFPGLTYAIAPFVKKKRNITKQAVQRSVDSLIQSGVIRKRITKDGDVLLELTRKGKWEAFIRGNAQDRANKQWDQMWRVVIFDVPLSKNKSRGELRRAMLLYGFKMLQQSVWVYPYACDDFIEIVKSHLGVSSNVLYMKVAQLENDSHLRKEFKLS